MSQASVQVGMVTLIKEIRQSFFPPSMNLYVLISRHTSLCTAGQKANHWPPRSEAAGV